MYKDYKEQLELFVKISLMRITDNIAVIENFCNY